MTGEDTDKLETICDCDLTENGFWDGLDVWICRPHILNKRISVMSHVSTVSISSQANGNGNNFSWKTLLPRLKLLYLDTELWRDIETLKKLFQECLKSAGVSTGPVEQTEGDGGGLTLSLRYHIPKNKSHYYDMFEFLLKDTNTSTVVFVPCLRKEKAVSTLKPVLSPVTYAFEYDTEQSKLKLRICKEKGSWNGAGDPGTSNWLTTKLWPKVCRWMLEVTDEASVTRKKAIPSLSLISLPQYGLIYDAFKNKYASRFIKHWPERTDPAKVVHQILGIAAYLLVMWAEERKVTKSRKKQSFVDLGCGNGLLTHILNSEGHKGIGIDVKRRKIWDLYGRGITLLEKPIVPSSQVLYPEYDWIIGTHSDELTPWIPVITARSSQTAKFFILPCCAHDFDAKFQRRNSNVSIYEDYVEFVTEVAKVCGFSTKRDKLKIPSTKRVVIIGSQRDYSSDDWPRIDQTITDFINERCSKNNLQGSDVQEEHDDSEKPDTWADHFQARPKVQQVRNCTQLSAELKSSIVQIIADALLESSDQSVESQLGAGVPIEWHKGGCLPLKELAFKIPPEKLKQLKTEFGGLKTLLKNHYHVFEVVGDNVSLQNYNVKLPFPKKRRCAQSAPTVKVRPCWFYKFHPDGCPLTSENCPFIH